MKTLILGIGNTLLSDEGVGIHALKALRQYDFGDNVELIDGGTMSFTLAYSIENCDQLIILDASELKAKPGTVKVFENTKMDKFITTGNKKTVHEVGLVDVMSIVLLSGNLPQKRALIGIQPKKIDWGDAPTPVIRKAIDEACQQTQRLIQKWKQI